MFARSGHLVPGFIIASAALGASPLPFAAGAHPVPESERWATITHPGNAPYTFTTAGTEFSVGRVDYEYQIARTEVTGAEWLEFVQAYAPYLPAEYVNASEFTSLRIIQTGPQSFHLAPGWEDRPITVGWRFAAIYSNWLHNDKRLDEAAFMNGAYDVTTFGETPEGVITDQVQHNPDARYWIPTHDEWVKAAHFDPDKNGPGLPGYWLFPTSSDTAPISGTPASGGQTSYGLVAGAPEVGGYTDVQSPWGLWDLSGGVQEWTESPSSEEPDSGALRILDGTAAGAQLPFLNFDQIDKWELFPPNATLGGFRLARAVPVPSWCGVFICAVLLVPRRRRQFDEACHSVRDFPARAVRLDMCSR